ncbi:MAG: YdcF family protein, partial [Lachnospiraceae bacterium]|nr:YdcF family protein [Lachnospiraceae bacterium]
MRFDTRDTKPKLWGLLIPAGLAAWILLMMSWVKTENRALYSCIVMSVLCVIVIISLLWAFREQIRYNPYSYNTIYYMGFALFTVSVLGTYVFLATAILNYPEDYPVSAVANVLLESAKTYMFITSPFILLFSAALCVSNISLIRHEGKRVVNVLGIILSFLMVGGMVFIFAFDYYATGSQTEVMIHDLIANFCAAVYLYFECMLIGTIIANIIVVRYEPDPDKDYMIVLGCGIRKDGTCSPLLRGRVDRALAFAKKQKELTGKELTFIVSGGQGPNEVIPESRAMKDYLLEQGVPEERIAEEDRSTSTFENMLCSKKIIEDMGAGGKVAFAT